MKQYKVLRVFNVDYETKTTSKRVESGGGVQAVFLSVDLSEDTWPHYSPAAMNIDASNDKPKGLHRIRLAFGHTARGLRGAFQSEAAFRQELALAGVLIPVALWLGDTPIERALLVLPVLLILIVELLNTGIEKAIDRVGTERHPLSGFAKDLGSAAVFVSFLLLAIVWGLLLL